MSRSIIFGDLFVTGTFSAKNAVVPANSVGDAQVQSGTPGAYINPTKIGHQYHVMHAQPESSIASNETKVMYRVNGATATIVAFYAGLVGINVGAATVTVDVKKNGVSVLTSPITLNNANASRVSVAGTLNGALSGCIAGDLFEVNIVASAGGGTLGNGVFAELILNEDPQ